MEQSEVGWTSGAGMPTDKQFTSQTRLAEGYVGTLYDYVARAYDPILGRFISADTIVPGVGNPAAFNRYMYVLGNPLGRTDPSGHGACAGKSNDDFWQCRWFTAHGFDNASGKWEHHTGKASFEDIDILTELLGEGGITWKNDTATWYKDELVGIATGVSDLLYSLMGGANLGRLLGNQTLAFVRRATTEVGCTSTLCAVLGNNEVEYSGGHNTVVTEDFAFDAVHEIGHHIGYLNRTPSGYSLARGYTGNERYSDAFPWDQQYATTQYAHSAAHNRKGDLEYFADAVARFVYETYSRPGTNHYSPLSLDQSDWFNHVFLGYKYP